MTMDEYRIRRTLKELKRAKTFHKFFYPGKSPILISTGCKFLLDNCDSSFLFDTIIKARELKILKGVNFEVWTLHQLKNDMSWIFTCSTSCDKKPLFILSIPVNDFPIPELTIWVIQNVALLRQEC
jgi:hypothetical protein